MKTEKHFLRKEIKQKLCLLSEQEKNRQSTEILQKIEQLPAFQTAETVLLYWSLPDEVDTQAFAEKWAARKTVLLPVVQGDEMVLRKYSGLSCLRSGAFGICEPEGEDFTDFDKIDLCIVPALAFDASGNRLGRGKGFYDRLLPRIAAPKIGVCFDVQLLNEIPCENFDAKMDFVISKF
ncbi:MAG: 5-formyltetrahydrofolate cyclo-ligase [Prevotellaceae bacterium]|jgi:5-formyltetrahydrofolate cyclo-ligase|nr:5-formyltetrahydrofolate cyclo-ligase [Prevotellaceae bacterium]